MVTKKEVKPFVGVDLKGLIYDISETTSLSIKKLCEELCTRAIQEESIIDELSKYFVRNVTVNNKKYYGSRDNPKINDLKKELESQRISLRFDENTLEVVKDLRFALDCSVAKVVSLLLEKVFGNVDIIDQTIYQYLDLSFDEKSKRKLQTIYEEIAEQIEGDKSIASLLLFISEEYKKSDENIQEAVNKFVSSW